MVSRACLVMPVQVMRHALAMDMMVLDVMQAVFGPVMVMQMVQGMLLAVCVSRVMRTMHPMHMPVSMHCHSCLPPWISCRVVVEVGRPRCLDRRFCHRQIATPDHH